MAESPKKFIRRSAPRPENWAFTRYELQHPENCRRNDEFMADTKQGHAWLNTYRADEDPEVETMHKNVYHGRNLAQNDDDEVCVARRAVFADREGKFVAWAQTTARDVIDDEFDDL